MAGEEIRVPIAIPVDTNADAASGSVDQLRERISESTESIRAMNGTLRQLRGTSDEVKSAKAALKAKIDALRDSTSAATLALVKQGTSYDAQAMKEKKLLEAKKKLSAEYKRAEELKAKDRQSALSAAIGKAGGPVGKLATKWADLKSVMGESSGAMGLATFAAAGTVAVIAALVAAVVGGVVSLGKFILTSANAARSANLLREAWSGTGANAQRLGDQVDALAGKVPTSKAALNDLAISLMKSKIGGQATVDAFNAIGQASAALGDEAGGKLKEFIERGRQVGRMQINPREMLEGFGNLDFSDVAGALAEQMHIGVDAAKKALTEGRVKLGDGAEALRAAVEKRFGDLNLRKMLDLNVMAEKFSEKLARLTSGVSLEPLLKPLASMAKLFDESTVTGQALKGLVTDFGTGMVTGLTAAIPLAKEFFQGFVLGTLKAELAYYQLRAVTKGLFGGKELLGDGEALRVAMWSGKVAAGALAIGLGSVAACIALIVKSGKDAIEVFQNLDAAFDKVAAKLGRLDMSAEGGAIGKGLANGLRASGVDVDLAGGELAERLKKVFKHSLGIASPSKVFAEYGKQTTEGYTQGVEGGTPDAQGATKAIGAGRPQGGAQGGAGGKIELHVHIDASGGGDAASKLSAPSFLALITKAVEDALTTAALPVLP